MITSALLLATLLAAPARPVAVDLPDGNRAEWRKGDVLVLLVLPRRGEGWGKLAARLTGDPGDAQTLQEENDGRDFPLRDVRVHVRWTMLRPALRLEMLRALFPKDRRSVAGWEHEIVAPWGGEGESWWEIAELWCGDGAHYREIREANPDIGLFPPKGTRVLIPDAVLVPDLRVRNGRITQTGATPTPRLIVTEEATPRPKPVVMGEATPNPRARLTPLPIPAALLPTFPPPAVAVEAPPPVVPTATPPPIPVVKGTPASGDIPLEYIDGHALYRLRPGEALYSAVVVRFTGQLHAADVNATAAELAKKSGIADVTTIPVGYPIRIPFDVLLPEFLPPGHPRRKEWEKEREELSSIKRAIRAANLNGIHIILDAGHGGGDSGATAEDVWESTYVYDVMTRVKKVLEKETKATVWVTVRDTRNGGAPQNVDELPQRRTQELLVDPPYDLSDSSTGVNLRWVLANALLGRLQKQKVSPERVAFVSLHADSLHPAVRGLMVYVPSRALRKSRGPSPSEFFDCRETVETKAPRFSAAFRSRSEALSTQLGEAIVRVARRSAVPVHQFQAVRSSVLRGGSRWVPAVLRYNRVPTAVLVEICNLNNESDREALLTWKFRERLAHAIAAGLAEGFSH